LWLHVIILLISWRLKCFFTSYGTLWPRTCSRLKKTLTNRIGNASSRGSHDLHIIEIKHNYIGEYHGDSCTCISQSPLAHVWIIVRATALGRIKLFRNVTLFWHGIHRLSNNKFWVPVFGHPDILFTECDRYANIKLSDNDNKKKPIRASLFVHHQS
jgi:hypothetical protein